MRKAKTDGYVGAEIEIYSNTLNVFVCVCAPKYVFCKDSHRMLLKLVVEMLLFLPFASLFVRSFVLFFLVHIHSALCKYSIFVEHFMHLFVF